MPHMLVSLNPLRCLDIDLAQPDTSAPSCDRLLDYLFAPESERTRDAFVRRYRKLLSGAAVSQLAPFESKIMQKLVWPLKQAIASFCLGDYLGVVALCGFVGEMTAILLWEISGGPNRPPDDRVQRLLGGAESFEKADQARRVEVLKFLRMIDSTTKGDFSAIRTTRREYLHYLSQSHEKLEVDARKAFAAATNVMAFLLDVSFPSPGVVSFRPELMAYLKARGTTEG